MIIRVHINLICIKDICALKRGNKRSLMRTALVQIKIKN